MEFRPKLSKPTCGQRRWRTNKFSMPLDCFPSLLKVRASGSIGTICSYPTTWTNDLTEWRASTVLRRSSLGWPKCILIYSVFFPFNISASGNLSLKNDDYSFFYQKWNQWRIFLMLSYSSEFFLLLMLVGRISRWTLPSTQVPWQRLSLPYIVAIWFPIVCLQGFKGS